MVKKKQHQHEDASILDIAGFFIKDIEKLSKSNIAGEKNVGLIAMLLCISGAFIIAFGLQQDSPLDLFARIVFLALGGILSAIFCLLILKLILPLSNAINHDKFGQDIAISILFLSIAFSISGYALNFKPFIVTSIIFALGGVFFLYPIISFFKIPIEEKERSETKFGFWSIMGKINLITGSVSGIITLISLVITVL